MDFWPSHWRAGATIALNAVVTSAGNAGAGEDNLHRMVGEASGKLAITARSTFR